MSPTSPFSLSQRYAEVRAQTLALTEGLSAEDLQAQSMADASPGKWHLAHTTWFFETFVLVALAGQERSHAGYNHLFNSYYDAIGRAHPRAQRGLLTRPSLEQVLLWRNQVDLRVLELLGGGQEGELLHRRLELGLHHEQQHQELLLTDLKHLFSENPLSPAWRSLPPPSDQAPPPLQWRTFAGGLCEIGHQADSFAFDNEGPRHQVFLQPFAIASRPVSVGEYLEFMADHGYARPELWLSEGFATALGEDWQAPLYWRRDGQDWLSLSSAGLRKLDLAEPVCHLSHYEADAFARWAGARLPTEAEWEQAMADQPFEGNGAETHPLPLAAVTGPGWVWEWTASPYVGYPGYRPPVGALGEYNGKFMSNQMVLRGASCATARGHLRASYRNFFPPAARWQFSGLRLARDS